MKNFPNETKPLARLRLGQTPVVVTPCLAPSQRVISESLSCTVSTSDPTLLWKDSPELEGSIVNVSSVVAL